ncbi:protein serine/threonine phosphatase 2C [Exidia glandulosa HHB12029]|uniref:Protein serine/threonine phosphatase 2C n=1 Tax=Exidia glandulosa HHB12029 TaxID=1314781 RepID=A0A165R1E3_EXIGL|nr:protein serine/threonine phosphatase 2C [Exidia glandulosa HHB12029]
MFTAFARYRRPLAALGILGPTAYLSYKYYNTPVPASTFQISIRQRTADGKVERVPMSLPLLPHHEVERRLKQHEILARLPHGWRYTTSQVNSNDPIEDAHASAVVSPGELGSSAGEMLMFAVMDGHGGFWTSKLLSKTLLPGVALELQTLNEVSPENSKGSGIVPGLLAYVKSAFSPHGSSSSTPPPVHKPKVFASDPTYVQIAMKTAFANLDSEIVNAPYRMLAPILSQLGNSPLDLEKYPMLLPSLLPALSGSCALVALVDTTHNNLYVACTGDSRAVAGVVDADGRWKVDVLTEDQTGRNPTELKRLQSEHPADEVDHVVQRGRILGGLEPSRAFGDSRYKWPRAFQERLAQALSGTDQVLRKPPAALRTPPYVTSEPVLTHRHFNTSPPAGGPALRFVVLATDGLWDELSSSEVVALVGAHLRGTRGPVPKAELAGSLAEGGNLGLDGKQIQRKPYTAGESWTFEDENLSTHLIRNALGGGNAMELRKSMSIPAPHSRRFRDDITVTVVWWEDHDTLVGAAESGSAQPPIRARL